MWEASLPQRQPLTQAKEFASCSTLCYGASVLPPTNVHYRDRRVQLFLERLEDRLLTTYTVNALTDTGAGQQVWGAFFGYLRYCINQLNATGQNANTIIFNVARREYQEPSLCNRRSQPSARM